VSHEVGWGKYWPVIFGIAAETIYNGTADCLIVTQNTTTGKWEICDPNGTEEQADGWGLVTGYYVTDDTMPIMLWGERKLYLQTFTPGKKLYVNARGELTDTEPGLAYSVCVGRAITSTLTLFDPRGVE